MPVMTRKATAQDLELKLRTALQELKDSKLQCQQLLQEREDSEEEVINVNSKNSSLKRELVDLHQEFLNVVNERDQLRAVTDGFNSCSNLYEEALCKIRDLEDELIHANVKLLNLKKEKDHTQAMETEHLYNELVNTNCHPHSIITIDLTEDSLLKHNYSHKISQNKMKKYARLNRIIKKCNKYKKQQKHHSKNIQLRKERVSLVNKLNNYQIKLEDSINIYEIDTQRLQSEIQALNKSLKSLYNKYEHSQNQIKEHILATNALVDKVDSLTLSNTQCTCQRESSNGALQLEAKEDPSLAITTQNEVVTNVNAKNVLDILDSIQSEDRDVIILTMKKVKLPRGTYETAIIYDDETDNETLEIDEEDSKYPNDQDDKHSPKKILRWLPKKKYDRTNKKRREAQAKKKAEIIKVRVQNAKRVAYILSIIEHDHKAADFLYKQVKRIQRDRLLVDDVREMILRVEGSDQAEFKAKVLNCLRKVKEEADVAVTRNQQWKKPTNNLVINK